jgi:hypothetical protein
VIKKGDASATRTLVVAESPDGGSTWEEVYRAPATGLGSVSALGPDHWLSFGPASNGPGTLPRPILETADRGRTWVTTGSLGTIDGAPIGWIDRLHGMATGQDDSGRSTLTARRATSMGSS